jgi:heme/copper-type cytochrome/quinol oxidase subunit 2
MRDMIIYFIVFVMTMVVAFYGEKKSKLQPSRDEKEFENRMVAIATALVVFIGFSILVSRLFNFYFC